LRADIYDFHTITGFNPVNSMAAEAQIMVDVTDAGGNMALFTFTNSGPIPMSMTKVYFDNGSVLDSIDAILNGPGVLFMENGEPPDLPAGENEVPPFVADFRATATIGGGPINNGVNPGETLGVRFNLIDGMTYMDLINELNYAATRVGIKVQGFEGSGSETFVNNPNPAVPAPGAALLGALGLAMIRPIKRRLSLT
jgi:hypothetical protein